MYTLYDVKKRECFCVYTLDKARIRICFGVYTLYDVRIRVCFYVYTLYTFKNSIREPSILEGGLLAPGDFDGFAGGEGKGDGATDDGAGDEAAAALDAEHFGIDG